MAKTPERRRLDALLAKTDKIFRDAFGEYVRAVRSPKIIAQIVDALERGDQAAAEEVIRVHIVRMGSAVPIAFTQAGVDAAGEAVRLMRDNALAFSFDPTHPRAAAMIRQERLAFIREMTNKQLDSVRYSLAEGFEAGAGAAAKGRRIREAIGLTTYQLRAVDNYRRLLEEGSAEALDRDLRDRRSDSLVRRARREGKPLKRAEIARMVARYHERYLAMRAETIARTESTRATSLAREENYEQIVQLPGIGHNRLVRVWNATLDGRTREWHASMQGQKRARGQAFIDGQGNALMYPGDSSAPAETVINCRCVLTMELIDPD
jgi:hypothetical protein